MANEILIWNLLMDHINNPYGAAAIMGNLRAESNLNPLAMGGKNKSQWKSGKEYTNAVKSGEYGAYSFAHDSIAFGLVQWLFWSRKQALHVYSRNPNMDIASEKTQIDFMIQELRAYPTVWDAVTNATDIQTPCDLFMVKYEKPGTITEAAKQKRRDYAQGYFDRYHNMKPNSKEEQKIVRTTADRVNARSGNGKEYSAIGQIVAKGTSFPWVATAVNGWHAIKFNERVLWVSPEYSEVVTFELTADVSLWEV